MTSTQTRLQYIKNVLGIKSIIIPEGYQPKARIFSQNPMEFAFQTFNNGQVLFLSSFAEEKDKNFSVEELQLLEKIIVALKLKFEKTDIAKVKHASKSQLALDLKSKNYSYVFLLGETISSLFQRKNQFEECGVNFFATFHPQDMIQNPDLKKEAWNGFKVIMENLPR
ncbi:MAG: hypothetical protein V4596_11170 [Bdellovibrionota bacterium]